MTHSFTRTLVASLALALATGALAQASEPRPQGRSGGTLIIGQQQEPASMIMAESSTPVSAQFYTALLINEPLLRVDHDFALQPALLVEVPTLANGGISEDFRVFTLRLRPGLEWQDGTPITMHDLAYTWTWVTNPANNAYATHGWERVESVEVSDDGLTAVVTLYDTFAFWLSEAVIGMAIIPEHAMERAGSRDAFNQAPIGNGPFQMVEWRIGDFLMFERNDRYWRGPAYLDRVVVRVIPDANAHLAQTLAGDIHVGLGYQESSYPQLARAGNLNVLTTNWPILERIFVSQTVPGEPTTPHPILTDRAVRAALNHAIDRETIVDTVYFGINPVAVNELQGTAWFNDELEPYAYDPELANRLLDEAGWVRGPDGIRSRDGVRLSFTWSTTAGNRARESTQAIAQQNWADVGIEVGIQNYPPPSFFGGWNGVAWGRRYELAQFSNGIFTLEPNMADWWHSDAIPLPERPFGNGHSGWQDDRVDELLAEHRRGVAPERAQAILHEVQRIIYDDYAMIPLFTPSTIFAVSNRVHNVNPVTFGAHAGLYWDVHNWWME